MAKRIKGPWDKQTQEIIANEVSLLARRIPGMTVVDMEKLITASLTTIANSVWASARKEFKQDQISSLFSSPFSSYTREVSLPKDQLIDLIQEVLDEELESIEDRLEKLENK